MDRDPLTDFVVGRLGARITFPAAMGLAFVSGLGLAALSASHVVSGDVAFGAFLVFAICISWWSSPAAAGVVAAVLFLFANGFAFDSEGTLTWHGEADLLRLAALMGVAVTVSVLGNVRRVGTDEGRQSTVWGTERDLHR